MRNRRALARLVVDASATLVWNEHEQPGVVTDLAYGGLFVECEKQPAVAMQVRVLVRVEGELVTFPGVVRWIGERGVGVQFSALGAAEAHAVGMLLGLPDPGR